LYSTKILLQIVNGDLRIPGEEGGRLQMLRSRFLRGLILLVVVALGVTLVSIAGSIGPWRNREAVTPGPWRNREAVTPPPPGTPATPLREVHQATAADEAKGIFSGPIGEFLVTPGEKAAYPPCPEPITRTINYKTSELYSPIFGDPEVYQCGNGKIVNIAIIGGPSMGRRYFVGPAKLPFEGPFDRLVLLTVGGHSAIAQLPHPAFPGSLRLTVIERFPTSNDPGILVWLDDAGSSLEKAKVLAARIMGVQP
jgi:hypothetical protein